MQIPKEKIRKKIENEARKIFLDKGYSNASMRDIAKKAKISTSNLYTYFISKEELFHSIVFGTFKKITKLQQTLVETEEIIGTEQFFNKITKYVAEPIGELIKNNHTEFLLLLDKSQGTKYEMFKNKLIKIIENHFLEHIQVQTETKKEGLKDTFVIHIIATNFLEGFLEIARHYKTDEWTDYNIESFMKYHINGIKVFF
ncbi:MAG: TetR/AcrR family transcriptional regulator [Candidatus Thorarchaeota archaeon]